MVLQSGYLVLDAALVEDVGAGSHSEDTRCKADCAGCCRDDPTVANYCGAADLLVLRCLNGCDIRILAGPGVDSSDDARLRYDYDKNNNGTVR